MEHEGRNKHLNLPQQISAPVTLVSTQGSATLYHFEVSKLNNPLLFIENSRRAIWLQISLPCIFNIYHYIETFIFFQVEEYLDSNKSLKSRGFITV